MISETAGIKKVSAGYMLAYIFLPIIIAIVITVFGAIFLGNLGVILGTVSMMAAFLWWGLLGNSAYEHGKKKKLKDLEQSGFTPNHTFHGEGCTVVVDLSKNKIALLFRWNPSKIFVRPATALSKVHTEDGKSGHGIMEGSMRVRFVFFVEGIRINVDTFLSNRRYAMDSEEIQTGIEKANRMVESLVRAGASAS